jgi:hypothetical protein
MDLLMGTRGWRRFEWQPVLGPLLAQRGVLAPKAGTGEVAGFDALRKKPSTTTPTPDKPIEVAANELRTKDEAAKADPVKPARLAEREANKIVAQNQGVLGVTKARDKEAGAFDKADRAERAPPKTPAAAATMAAPKATRAAAAAGGEMAAMGKGMGAAGGDAKKKMERRAAPADDMDAMADLAAPPAAAPAAEPAMPQRPMPMGGVRGRIGDMEGPMGGLPMHGVLMPRPAVRRKPVEPWAPVRVFPAPNYEPGYTGPRSDFRETVFWAPSVQTGQDGKAQVSFSLSDAITSFRVVTEGVGGGAAGRDETIVRAALPFSMAVKLPLEVSEGDKIRLPLVLTNEHEQPLDVGLSASFGDLLKLDQPVERSRGLLAARARDALYYPLTVTGKKGKSEVRFTADAQGLRDEFVREIRVAPRGFPQHIGRSGRVKDVAGIDLDLGEVLAGTLDGQLKVYTSHVSTLVAGLDGMLSEPSGCFEQTSSINYPNVMILRYLREQHTGSAGLIGRANRLIDDGYRKLTAFETPSRGYEWFGSSPGHEALTAYGLLEFTDMRAVYKDVDGSMMRRTADWLRARRDGKGGFHKDGKSLDTFGAASREVTNAYIAYALAEARSAGFDAEIAAQEAVARSTKDAYILALATNTMFASGRTAPGHEAAKRLVAMQESDGGWKKAGHSITRSGGENLQIETTALAVLGLLRSGSYDESVERGVEWLVHHRRGIGAFGSTQATVLGLKALTAYHSARPQVRSAGTVALFINGQKVGEKRYEPEDKNALIFAGLSKYLSPGKNRVELRHSGTTGLPYSLAIDYRATKPATSPQASVDLTTTLARGDVKLGESVRMNVTLTNKKAEGQPMTLARIELPGGLTFQTWQLKELREKGLVAFYETAPRQVNLYLREMKPSETLQIPLDLVAIAPGEYTAQASTAYLYYTDEHKVWVAGTQVRIEP